MQSKLHHAITERVVKLFFHAKVWQTSQNSKKKVGTRSNKKIIQRIYLQICLQPFVNKLQLDSNIVQRINYVYKGGYMKRLISEKIKSSASIVIEASTQTNEASLLGIMSHFSTSTDPISVSILTLFQVWICSSSYLLMACCVPDFNPCHEENKYYKCPALV